MVVNTPRINSELGKTYQPLQVNFGTFQTDPSCQLVAKPRVYLQAVADKL